MMRRWIGGLTAQDFKEPIEYVKDIEVQSGAA